MITYDVIEHGKPLQKVIKETPKPTGTEVLLRVTRSGVCHSDLHIWDGYFDLGGGKRFYVKDRGCVPPFTMGHEPFGVVEAAGPRAKGAKVDQKRLVFPWIGCGKCPVCNGEGTLPHPNEAIRKLHEEWKEYEPPAGAGYQLWETCSEGSPISPVFASAEELADWCAENATIFASEKTSRENWLKMFVGEEDLDTGSLLVMQPGFIGALANAPK